MIIYDLRCPEGHTFEGWFAGREEYEREARARRLECPACGSRSIELVPSGGHLVGSRAPAAPASPPGRGGVPARARKTLLAALAEAVERDFEDVGPRFRDEALKMHAGEAEARNIRGSMTPEEEKELTEEGVEFSRLPLPRFQG